MFRGSVAVSRFRVEGEPLREEEVGEGLVSGGFLQSPSRKSEVSLGWVRSGDMASSDFSDSTAWLIDGLCHFGLRIDRCALPAALFRAELAKRVTAWAEERGVEKVPASVRGEIKRDLEDEWCRRQLPRVKVLTLLLDPRVGELLVLGTLSDTDTDLMRKKFFSRFRRKISPSGNAVDGEIPGLSPRCLAARPYPGGLGELLAAAPSGSQVPGFLLSEWVLWLWMREETGFELDTPRGKVSLGSTSKLRLEGSGVASFRCGEEGLRSDSRQAVLAGKFPAEISLPVHVLRGEEADPATYSVTISARTSPFRFKVSLPRFEAEVDSYSDLVWEGRALLREAIAAIDALLLCFLGEREQDGEGLLARLEAHVGMTEDELQQEEP